MNDFNIMNSLESGFARIFEYLPQVLGALLLLIVGYLVAKLLESIVKKLLHSMQFDSMMHRAPGGSYITRVMQSPSGFTGSVVFWLTFLGFLSMAVAALNLPMLNQFIGSIYAYLPHVLAAIVIFLVASAIAAGTVAFVNRVMGNTPTARLVSTVVPTLVMSIAVFMILNELMISQEIVLITYTALIGAAALGLALAFGLGGRDHAARLLDQAYQAAERNVSTAKQDMARAKRNTEGEVNKIRSNKRR